MKLSKAWNPSPNPGWRGHGSLALWGLLGPEESLLLAEGQGPGCAASIPSDPSKALQNEAPLWDEHLAFIFQTVLMMENVKCVQSRVLGVGVVGVLPLPAPSTGSGVAPIQLVQCPSPALFSPSSLCFSSCVADGGGQCRDRGPQHGPYLCHPADRACVAGDGPVGPF